MKKTLKYLVAAIAAGLITSAFADVSLVTVSPTNAPVTYTPIPAAVVSTPAPVSPSLSASTGFSSTLLGGVLGKFGLVTDPTNYAFGTFIGKSASGNQTSAGVFVIENVNNYVGVMLGVDHLWGGGKIGSANIVSGGLTIKDAMWPLRYFTSNTNTWAYNARVTPYAALLAGSALGNTGSAGGGLAAIVRTGANVDLFTFKNFIVGLGGDYGTRAGSGNYNGNWYDVTFNARIGF